MGILRRLHLTADPSKPRRPLAADIFWAVLTFVGFMAGGSVGCYWGGAANRYFGTTDSGSPIGVAVWAATTVVATTIGWLLGRAAARSLNREP